MEAITLHQPWASLIAVRAKTVETRSWLPPRNLLRKRIAIHAGKTLDKGQPVPDSIHLIDLPRGAIVATARLADACRVTGRRGDYAFGFSAIDETMLRLKVDAYGDFSLRRCLWLLEDIEPLDEPIPARGYQGFWDCTEIMKSAGIAPESA